MKTNTPTLSPFTPRIAQPWKMLCWILLAQLLVAFLGRSLAPLGVFIGESLSLSNAQIGMLPASLFFGQFAASIPAGMIADRWGSRLLIFLITLVMFLSFMLISWSVHFAILLFFIFTAGCGYGAMHPASNRGILYWFDTKTRGTAMGIKQMGVTGGSALAALFLVPLSHMYGWRIVLTGAAVLLLIGGMLSFLRYIEPPAPEEKQTKDPAAAPVSKLALLKNKLLLLLSFGALGLNGVQMCLNTYIIIFAVFHLEFPIFFAGLLLVFSEVGGSIGRITWGLVSDRLLKGYRMSLLAGISLVSSFIFAYFAVAPATTSFFLMAVLTFIVGLCVSGFNGLWMNAATEIVSLKSAGLASGISISIGSWGVIAGPPLFGWTADQTGGFSTGWSALAVLLVLLTILFTWLYQQEKKVRFT